MSAAASAAEDAAVSFSQSVGQLRSSSSSHGGGGGGLQLVSFSAPSFGGSDDDGGGGVTFTGLVTRSFDSIVRETQPIEQRYNNAIVVHRFFSATQRNALGAAGSELILQGQSRLGSDDLYVGLTSLKHWARHNVHRALVPEKDPRRRALLRALSPDAMCVAVSPEASGVRSYLKLLCEELRVDLFVVGGTYYKEGMMQDLLKEARKSTRALILFDRTMWFTAEQHPSRGADFMHQLTSLINYQEMMMSPHAARCGGGAASAASMTLENSFSVPTVGSVLPGLWIVISTSSTNVHTDVVQMAAGCFFRVQEASDIVAFNATRGALKKFVGDAFDEQTIEYTLSQSPYLQQLKEIARILHDRGIGSVLRIIRVAYGISLQRDMQRDTHQSALIHVLPTAIDVTHAVGLLSGQALGGVGAIAATTTAPPSEAAMLAQYMNQQLRK